MAGPQDGPFYGQRFPTSPEGRGRGGNYAPLAPVARTSATGDLFGVDASLLLECVSSVIGAGAAVLLAPTSDGGAISVTYFNGTDRRRSYATGREQLEAVLLALRDAVRPNGGGVVPQATFGPKTRT